MILLIIMLPIIGSLISGLLGRYIGYIISRQLATLCIIISCLLSYYLYIDVMIFNNIYTTNIGKWIHIEHIEVDWGFIIDELAVSLLIPIVTISSLVHIYANGYMSHDPHQSRFFSILSMFTGFMIILVTGNNYVIMFLGWELIGVASYLLISFWYTGISNVKSGLSALLMNKFGDTFITIGLFILLYTFGSLNYSTIYSLSVYINTDILNIIMICLLIGCAAKSAQLGLHNWLLHSMAGPTPVSALLHAACLVCAGVYLLLRSSYILEYTPIVLLYILWLGGLTTIIAGLIAIVSNDLKKIIALSTMSQLGLMFVAIGISNYNISLFHLFNHAMFKALLFMSAGSIIHSIMYDTQDIRNYGGLTRWLPITYVCILIASLSLMATPGLTGFYSKDIIIESTYGVYNISGYIVYIFSVISATLTTLYSFRLIYYVFYNVPNANKYSYHTVHESGSYMIIPMIILAIASILVGYIFKDLYIGLGSPFNSLFTHPNNLSIVDTEFSLPTYIKLLPTILTIISVCSVLYIYEYHYNLLYTFNNKLLRSLYTFGSNRFMTDQLLNNIIVRYILNLSLSFNHFIDKGILHILGPTGIFNTLNIMSYKLISLSTNIYNNNKLNNNNNNNNLNHDLISRTGIRHYTTYFLSTLLFILLAYNFNTYLIILFILLLFI
uniref:NADH-ubiquinone oxidoreductase chain 5 n=1 Tax=Blastobotrys adeninivorans TaxID=409370 RepID=A0A060RCS4_BLAAD